MPPCGRRKRRMIYLMKRLTTRAAALATALALTVSLAACNNIADTSQSSSVTVETEEATPVTPEEAVEAQPLTYPMTLTDQAGRTVTIESEPQTIVSGYYISSSLLIALGRADRMVGIEAKADTRPIYSLSAPELLELPSVGSAKEFDLEGCAALEPDLVILPLKLESAADSLTELGIPVLLINPEDRTLLAETITLVGQATNSVEAADDLLAFTEEQQTRLETTLADADRPDVYLAGNSDLLSTAGSTMYQSDLIDLAGGRNVAEDITDTYWVDIDYEQLLAWDPDYIILASDASYTCDDVLNDANLADCTAVKNGNVYQMPGDAEAWDSPVPGGILGAVWLSTVLHPDLCSTDEANAVMGSFYENFYGFTYPLA